MTVPGAVDLIRALAPTLPDGFLLGAGTVPMRQPRARASTPAHRSSSARSSGRDADRGCHGHDVAATPGCFTPTEILDAWEAGADIVKVFPATALGPGSSRTCGGRCRRSSSCRPAASRSRTPATGSRAGAVAVGIGTSLARCAAIEAATSRVMPRMRERMVENVNARGAGRRDEMDAWPKIVTFGEIMLRLSPPGSERFLQSPPLSPRSAAAKPTSRSASRTSGTRAARHAPARACDRRGGR